MLPGILLSALSGVILVLSFPPYSYSFLIWFSLVPFFTALTVFSRTDISFGINFSILAVVWFTGMLRNIPPDYELIYAIPVIVSVLFFLLTFRLRGIFAVSGFRWFTLLMATGFTGFEFLRQYLPTAQFAMLGISQYAHPEIIQIASWFGVPGITFLIIMVNCTIALPVIPGFTPGRFKLQIAVNILIIASLVSLNFILLGRPLPETGRITASAVQLGLAPEAYNQGILARSAGLMKEKKSAEATAFNLDIMEKLTVQELKNKAHIIVWPEIILLSDPFATPGIKERISALAVKTGAYIVVPYLEYIKSEIGKAHPSSINGTWVISPAGEYIFSYLKQHRVRAFGVEKGPAGNINNPLDTSLGRLGLFICYDTDYNDLVTDQVNKGAGILIIPTHDMAEFITRHHPYMLLFRAVEHGRSLVKADFVHGTIITDPRGRIIADPADGTCIVTADVPLCRARTMFHILAPLFGAACCIIFLAATLLLSRKRETGPASS